MNLNEWSIKWSIPFEAVEDLRRSMTAVNTDPIYQHEGESEAAVQTRVRLEASSKGMRLWRNNSGAMYDEKGNFIRFGLCNDSEKMNKEIKSADLIGIKKLLITDDHVGTFVGQLLAREIKPDGWAYTGTDREKAQLKFLELVLAFGGDAQFANSEGSL